MFVTHTINLLDHFSPADTVIFRFRLFADQLENSWGWTVDDIKIQIDENPLTGVENKPFSVLLFPNPAKENLVIQLDSELKGSLKLSIVSLGGQTMARETADGRSKTTEMNISHLPPGIYLLRIESAGYNKNFRFIKQ